LHRGGATLLFRQRARNSSAGIAVPAQNRGDKMNQQGERRSGWSWWYLLFLIQFIAVLWVPFYNSAEPVWAGIPFFYWYQMLWVILGAILTAIVYFATND
jgi:Protein of unknown function (DUF3311)